MPLNTQETTDYQALVDEVLDQLWSAEKEECRRLIHLLECLEQSIPFDLDNTPTKFKRLIIKLRDFRDSPSLYLPRVLRSDKMVNGEAIKKEMQSFRAVFFEKIRSKIRILREKFIEEGFTIVTNDNAAEAEFVSEGSDFSEPEFLPQGSDSGEWECLSVGSDLAEGWDEIWKELNQETPVSVGDDPVVGSEVENLGLQGDNTLEKRQCGGEIGGNVISEERGERSVIESAKNRENTSALESLLNPAVASHEEKRSGASRILEGESLTERKVNLSPSEGQRLVALEYDMKRVSLPVPSDEMIAENQIETQSAKEQTTHKGTAVLIEYGPDRPNVAIELDVEDPKKSILLEKTESSPDFSGGVPSNVPEASLTDLSKRDCEFAALNESLTSRCKEEQDLQETANQTISSHTSFNGEEDKNNNILSDAISSAAKVGEQKRSQRGILPAFFQENSATDLNKDTIISEINSEGSNISLNNR